MKRILLGLMTLTIAASCTLTPLDTDSLPEATNTLETALAQTVIANSIVNFLNDTTSSKPKKVLFLGYDGVRADAMNKAPTPAIEAITTDGGLYLAYTGGVKNTDEEQMTYSGPGWATLLTGVWADKHEFVSNGTSAKSTQTPSFLKQAKALNYKTASFVNWGVINNNILKDEIDTVIDTHKEGITDAEVKDETLKAISTGDSDVIFVAFDDPDHAGHGDGFSPLVQEYLDQITLTDSYAKLAIEAVKARTSYAEEDWLIIITTDHGGIGKSHGGQSSAERTIWFAINQPDYLPAQ
jgi:predicted AlkP superfamily pyrophosphatase or phosphodiesterase